MCQFRFYLRRLVLRYSELGSYIFGTTGRLKRWVFRRFSMLLIGFVCFCNVDTIASQNIVQASIVFFAKAEAGRDVFLSLLDGIDYIFYLLSSKSLFCRLPFCVSYEGGPRPWLFSCTNGFCSPVWSPIKLCPSSPRNTYPAKLPRWLRWNLLSGDSDFCSETSLRKAFNDWRR